MKSSRRIKVNQGRVLSLLNAGYSVNFISQKFWYPHTIIKKIRDGESVTHFYRRKDPEDIEERPGYCSLCKVRKIDYPKYPHNKKYFRFCRTCRMD